LRSPSIQLLPGHSALRSYLTSKLLRPQREAQALARVREAREAGRHLALVSFVVVVVAAAAVPAAAPTASLSSTLVHPYLPVAKAAAAAAAGGIVIGGASEWAREG